MVLSVNNKYEIPYGILSLGYTDPIKINSTTYMSVIDYITSELGRKINEPYEISLLNLWTEMENNIMNKAIRDAINAKLNQDPLFENLLMSAEDRPILYKSENNYLGVNELNEGQNVYGKWLTNFRNNLRGQNPDVFYNTFILDRLLKEAINFEPLDEYLEMSRKGISSKAIINYLYSKYNYVDVPSKQFVEEIRKNTADFNYQPEKVILNVMKNKIRKVRVANLNSFKLKVFNVFLTNFWKKYNFKYDMIKFYRKIESSERNYFINRIYGAYNKELLEKSQISVTGGDSLKPDKYIPSLDLIKKYESLEYVGISDKISIENINAIVDSKKSKLSLADDRVQLQIDGKVFPTMAHYIIYKLAFIIKDNSFDPYSIIFNKSDNMFYSLENLKKYFYDTLRTFKENYTDQKLYEGIVAKYNKPYIKDILKSTVHEYIPVRGFKTKFSSDLINDVKRKIPWEEVTKARGNVLDYVNSDDFFIFIQKDMFESFMNIHNVVFDSSVKVSHNNVKKVYEQFFGNVPGTVSKFENISTDYFHLKNMSESMNISLSQKSYDYLSKKFLNRILCAEKLAKNIFKTDILFMTKFLILEGRYRIFNGAFCIERNRSNIPDRSYLAVVKVINAISICNEDKVITTKVVDKAFSILNNVPNQLVLETQKNIEENETSENKIDVGVNPITSALIEDVLNDEDNNEQIEPDEMEEKEIEGYQSDSEENDQNYEFDDLVFASENFNDNVKFNPHYLAEKILLYLNPTKDVISYIKIKSKELVNSKTKNLYRINLYSC